MLDPTRQVFTIHTHKHPIVVQDETLFSTYYESILGQTFRRTHLRESAHRLIEKCMDEGLVEITEEESPIPLSKKMRLKITLLK